MSKLVWDKVGERFSETGVDQDVYKRQKGRHCGSQRYSRNY